jgi:hypothetical protein
LGNNDGMDKERKLVFISHANPEDNNSTLWLASRLRAAGYLVWSDLTQLFGGEIFWNDIEDAIRNHAAKVVVVLSQAAQQKDGVLDEINLAVSIERTHKLERFVVPVRIDDLPFGHVKSNLARKNIIDFQSNWADGLAKLLKVLERDVLPREQRPPERKVGAWMQNILAGNQRIARKQQQIIANWFRITELPKALNFFRVPIQTDKIASRFQTFPFPWFPYRDMVATFADKDAVKNFLYSHEYPTKAHTIPVSTILENEPHSLPEFERREAINQLSYLIRDGWNRGMRDKGLRSYEMANSGIAWLVSKGLIQGEWVKFADMDGVTRRRHLVGWSEKRKVYWHFAMQARPELGQTLRLALEPHVVFTADGSTSLSSQQRMHRLRRGFCKNWWNARWRDLMLAYTTFVANPNGMIPIPMGSEVSALIDARPFLFESPASLTGLEPSEYESVETDAELDAMAEDADWDMDEEAEEEDEDNDDSGPDSGSSEE